MFRITINILENCDDCGKQGTAENQIIELTSSTGRGSTNDRHVIFICESCTRKALTKAVKTRPRGSEK